MTERATKHERHRLIRELIAHESIGSQYELAARLAEAGYPVTQATVSRDIAELGLVKAPAHDGHAYVTPSELVGRQLPNLDARNGADDPRDVRLRRLLRDLPVAVGRSGLILVLRSAPGMANAIGQAIDESSLQEQEGTLAGDDTLLVLFADEPRLERWLGRFQAIRDEATRMEVHA
ncbi:MAG TPA: hypothetical protein VFK54_07070 [Candidatus Limnocylindrales bacterium]|nr:hypothetical protein [Candidatus Limnocylindrales bacterium]